MSREPCPRGSKDSASTLSRSGSGCPGGWPATAGAVGMRGGAGKERAQQQGCLQSEGPDKLGKAAPHPISEPHRARPRWGWWWCGTPAPQGPLPQGLSKRISKFKTCSISCGFHLFTNTCPEQEGRGAGLPAGHLLHQPALRIRGAPPPEPQSSTPPPQAGERGPEPNLGPGPHPVPLSPKCKEFPPQPHPGSDHSGGTPPPAAGDLQAGTSPSSRQTPT